MGTSLTGLTPATTYDALIKVGDNGPLSATAKVLSDGLGNDSILALSTTSVGIGTASPVTNLDINATIAGAYTSSSSQAPLRILNTTNAGGINSSVISMQCSTDNNASNPVARIGVVGESASSNNGAMVMMTRDGAGVTERMRITSAGNVGIGTTSPASLLSIAGSSATLVKAIILRNGNGTDGSSVSLDFETSVGTIGDEGSLAGRILGVRTGGGTTGALTFSTTNAGTLSEKVRILPTGGITFNGDTAAANALDDYEEGTWTGTLTPSTSGSIVLSSATQPFQYTKIGRQVTINGLVVISSVSSPVGLRLQLGGLPFTTANAANARGGGAVTFFDASASYAFTAVNGYSEPNVSYVNINFDSSTLAASDEFAFTFTYFV